MTHGEIEHRLHAGDARAAMLEGKMFSVNSGTDGSNRVNALRPRHSTLCRMTGAILAVVLTLIGTGPGGWAVASETEGPPHPPTQWRVSATVNYSSGSYGTDSRTNILYAPMTIRRIFQDGDVSLTIPFVSISGTGATRLVGGVPTRTSNAAASPGGALGAGPGSGQERVRCLPALPTAGSATSLCVAAII